MSDTTQETGVRFSPDFASVLKCSGPCVMGVFNVHRLICAIRPAS